MSYIDDCFPKDRWMMRLPVPVSFGPGCVESLAESASGYSKALVVTGRQAMKAAGVTDRVCALLQNAGIQCDVYNDVSPDPDHLEVQQGGEAARKMGADLIIGLGGGSAIDAAKAIAVAATHEGPILDYRANGPRQVTAATLPILAISSTSGTGSHIGRGAVVSNKQEKAKRAILSDFLYPKAAICDSEILKTMPADVTAATGFDAFAHALEGYLSRSEDPMGNLCATEAMRLIVETLPAAIADGDNLELRSKMAWADTLAGVSLATNAVVIPHVVAMVLGGRYGITHAPAIALVTAASLRHSRSGGIQKLAGLARLLGCTDNIDDEALADWAIKAVDTFIDKIGLKANLSDYGVTDDSFEEIGEEVMEFFAMRVDYDPVPTDAAGIARILHTAAESATG